jgi:hypothetical protein
MAQRIAVKELRAGSIEATPIDRDWSTGHDYEGFGDEGWKSWECNECEDCGEQVVLTPGDGGHKHDEVEDDTDCGGYVPIAEGPMMNYWYPVDDWQLNQIGGVEEAAKLIHDLPLCMVMVDGNPGMALTGGGMDLSWEICEAYTRLGLLPPVHFCKLPAMAGRGDSARDKYIISACRESLRVQTQRASRALKDLRRLGSKKEKV